MKTYTVLLQPIRKSKINPDRIPITVNNVLSGTIIYANTSMASKRLVLFTKDGKTHMYQADLYNFKIKTA